MNWVFVISLSLLFGIQLLGCKQDEQAVERSQAEESFMQKTTLSNSRDVLPIDSAELQQHLAEKYGQTKFRLPIWLSPTPQYLVPIGNWERVKQYQQVQGETFKEGSRFYPDPIRLVYDKFEGLFDNIILYNDSTKTSSLLLSKDMTVKQFWLFNPDNSGTGDYLMVFSTANPNDIEASSLFLKPLGSDTIVSPFGENQKVVDWSINPVSKKMVTMLATGGSETFQVVEYSLTGLPGIGAKN